MGFLLFVAACLVLGNNVFPTNSEVLHSATGEVGRGNFTYYSLMYTGFISLELISIYGDCDLYISQTLAKPTFEPESYCLQSSTCGTDVVVIQKSFKRPIGIGIFGHPAHELSSYLLLVHQIDGTGEFDEFTDELSLVPSVESTYHKSDFKKTPPKVEASAKSNENEEESFFWVVIWSVIDLLIEVLFL